MGTTQESSALPHQHQAHILIAEELSMTYPGGAQPALSAFNMTIKTGEIFGLLGPNGAGKTTCISILGTILRPSHGNVIIDHIDALQYPRRVRKRIGLVPQDIALYTQLTACENLRYFGRLHGLRGTELEDRIAASLKLVGLSAQTAQRIRSFSGGMKRRLNLAVGVLHQPKLLYLDEPTVGIDVQSRNLIMEQLAVLKDTGMTMVYTTHYMEEAEMICDRVAIIDEGRTIALGTPTELIHQTDGCTNLEDLFLNLTGKRLRD